MFTIEFVTTRPSVVVVHSEPCDAPRLIEARDRGDQRLAQLRQDNPDQRYDGYRILDDAGTTKFTSWVV